MSCNVLNEFNKDPPADSRLENNWNGCIIRARPQQRIPPNIATPPGWDASPSRDTSSISSGDPDSSPVPIYTPACIDVL